MAWTTPKTWAYKEAPGSEAFNEQVRDNLLFLKAMMPAGVMLPYGGATAPDQFLLCDGSAVSRTTYAALYTAIGVTYGVGDGSSTFNVPNLKGKIPVGKNAAETEFDALGEIGGAKTHTLSVAEMPSHNHGGNTGSDSGPGICGPLAADSGSNREEINPGSHSHTIASQGGDGAHNNLQPYLVTNYIIKY